MISANDLRNVQLTEVEKGFSVEEVNAVIDQAATTIEAQEKENKELYHKMEVLAAKMEASMLARGASVSKPVSVLFMSGEYMAAPKVHPSRGSFSLPIHVSRS